MAPVKSGGTRLNSNVKLLIFFKNELVCVCELLRHGRVGSDLFGHMRETLTMEIIFI